MAAMALGLTDPGGRNLRSVGFVLCGFHMSKSAIFEHRRASRELGSGAC